MATTASRFAVLSAAAGMMALAGTAWTVATALAAPATSSATSRLNLDRCRNITPRDDSRIVAAYRCKGFQNIAANDVYIHEIDDRFHVSYGPDAAEQKVAGQTLGPANALADSLEWRLERGGGDWRPFATVLRYYTDVADDDGFYRGEVLVITKIGRREACHVAYIDALANANATRRAREIADHLARTFDCAKDEPMVHGERGRSLGPLS